MLDEKQKLREALAQRLAALPELELQAEDKAIYQTLTRWEPYRRAKTLFCYVSVGREVDTRALLRHALEKGKEVYVPKCSRGGEMKAARIGGMEELVPGFFGLPEPRAQARVVKPQDIGLVVVPCVACDEGGTRLGQGGGYYDRYLPRVQGQAVCLCRQALLQKHLPRDPHDVLLPHVLTGRGFAVGGEM